MRSGKFSGLEELIQTARGRVETDISRHRSFTSRWRALLRASSISIAALGALEIGRAHV